MGGLSGAFLLLPFQVSILGFNSPAVSPTNLIYNMFAIPGGLFYYIQEKRMVWPIAMATILGTIPGLVLGAFMRIYWFRDPEIFKLFVGLVLLYVCLRLVLDIVLTQRLIYKTGSEINTFEIRMITASARKIEFKYEGARYHVSAIYLFLLALVVGVIGGAYGIGGGAIISPFIVAVFGLPVHAVAGAALMGTMVTSVAGVLIYQFLMPLLAPGEVAVHPDWLLGMSMGFGGLLGIYLGARFQRYFPEKFIKGILALSIAVIVVRYVGGFFF
jgi:uncharacterized membrane protein YfcA